MGTTSSRSRAPRRAFTGAHRKMITKLKFYLLAVKRADQREVAKAAKLGVAPLTFQTLGGTSVENQQQVILTRCNDALGAKVGGATVVPTGGGGGGSV